MNEEERQSIESLRKNRGVSFAQADIISNLIDKQEKEIEELTEELQMYVDTNVMKEKLEKEIEELNTKILELTNQITDGFWENDRLKNEIEKTEKENEQLKIMIYDIYNFVNDVEGRLKNVLESFNKEEE